jgi:hypothetical protein
LDRHAARCNPREFVTREHIDPAAARQKLERRHEADEIPQRAGKEDERAARV